MRLSCFIYISLLIYNCSYSQQGVEHPDTLQYPAGYPENPKTVIEQLSSYPLPRYLPSNKLQHLFNWMDPYYMGGLGQKGINISTAATNAVAIQKELATNYVQGIMSAPLPGTPDYNAFVLAMRIFYDKHFLGLL